MQRWAIPLDGATKARLTQEQLELGTVMDDGRLQLLVFRDRFAGLRVASAAGARLEPLPEANEPLAV